MKPVFMTGGEAFSQFRLDALRAAAEAFAAKLRELEPKLRAAKKKAP